MSTQIINDKGKALLGSLLAVAPFLLLLLLYFPTLKKIALICWQDDNYSHGLLLPFITAYLVWANRHRIFAEGGRQPAFSWIGLLLLALAIPFFFVGQIGESLFASWISFFPALLGVTYLVLGSRVGFALSAPLLLNFLAKPLPDALVPKLFNDFQSFAAMASTFLLQSLQMPVYLRGNVIEIPGMNLLVEEACSGMRSLMSLLTVSLIVIYLFDWQRVVKILLIPLSVVVALFFNVLRVTLTGALAYYYNPQIASGFLHNFSGMVTFILGLIVLYACGAAMEWVSQRREA